MMDKEKNCRKGRIYGSSNMITVQPVHILLRYVLRTGSDYYRILSNLCRPLPMKCCPISFPHSNDFATRSLEAIFFNADISSISFEMGRITKQGQNTFVITQFVGITTNYTRNKRISQSVRDSTNAYDKKRAVSFRRSLLNETALLGFYFSVSG